MPLKPSAFTIAHSGITNVIQTQVEVCPAFDPLVLPHPQHKTYNAIWDTGATASVISKNVVDHHNLQPIDMVNVHTAGGLTACNVYLVNLILTNKVSIPDLRVTQASLHTGCDLLIGMDVICAGDFAITNKEGKTVCTFRHPSHECIDFVKDALATPPPAHSTKISRNGPCPCGSRKKYKQCCGK